MSALDKFYDFTLNLPDAKLTSKAMSLCNIDRNVFNIYLTLQEGKNNPILNADLGNYTVTMIVVKPKTKEYVEKVGVVDGSNDRLLFELGDTFNDQIGSYKGEIKVQNGNEVITSSSFAYTVTQSLISGLNAEIEASPDVEILRQLINEVKAVVGMTPGDPDSLLTDYQKKNDNTLITTDKTIIGAINENSLQIKDIAKDVLLEDGKLYLKKSDGTKLGTGVVLPLSGSGGSVTWESLTGKPTTFTPSSHSHSKSDITDFPTIPTKTSELNNDSGFLTSHQDLSNYVQKETGKGLSTNDLTTILKQNYDNAYTHSQSTHAPANAQKNSDITKEEIETKLTGKISSHSHTNCVPTGGTSGQVLAKVDETDYNTNWINPPSSEWVKLGKITLTPEIVSAEWDIPNAKELFLMLKNTDTSIFEAGWLKHHINNGGERGISPAVKIDAGKYIIMSIQNINRNVVTRFSLNISDVFGGGVDQLRTIFTMIDTDYITHYKILPDNVPVLMDVEVYYR